jgi:nitroimidazol reductase NimA-like FMN-containing flavoprotein (pyridoxamine 5'-phosphate oxidase superfamily)
MHWRMHALQRGAMIMALAIDKSHAEVFLQTHHIGRLACSVDDRPYIVPVTYVYDDGYIYGHTNDGLKLEMLRRNPRVAFEVDDITNHRRWRSVVCSGRFEELEGEEMAKALDLMISRLTPLSQESGVLESLGLTDDVAQQIKLRPTKGATYRIAIDEISGRYDQP